MVGGWLGTAWKGGLKWLAGVVGGSERRLGVTMAESQGEEGLEEGCYSGTWRLEKWEGEKRESISRLKK